jgi:hypothetical protein
MVDELQQLLVVEYFLDSLPDQEIIHLVQKYISSDLVFEK